MISLVLTLLAADPNTDGFAAYKAGDYAKAAPLFDKAVKANPKHTWAWLNRARTLAMLAKGAEPDDYCAYETNWVFLALDALEHAAKLDKAKLLAKLEEPDPGSDALKKRPEVKVWLAAITFDGDAAKLLTAQPDWHSIELNGGITKPLTLDPKAWKASGAQVTLTEGKKSVKYELKPEGFFFDQGRRSFTSLTLVGPQTTWWLGPVLADCG